MMTPAKVFSSQRRAERPKRPCRWCASGHVPAEYRTKWPVVVQVEDIDGELVDWSPPRVIELCAFHMRHAVRYAGVRAYRFRSV